MENRVVKVGSTTAKVILDSTNQRGRRIITVEVEYPTFLQAQLNTHKIISKNSASQRAIPTSTWLYKVPVFIPSRVALYQKGMEEHVFLNDADYEIFKRQWLEWEQLNVDKFEEIQSFWLERRGRKISKGLMNRPLAAFRYTRTVLTGIEDNKGWGNYIRLRLPKDAQVEHQRLAKAINVALLGSEPTQRPWHLPYAPEGLGLAERIWWSTSQCAQVSYRKKTKGDHEKNRERFDGLKGSGHWSTYEHQGPDVDAFPELAEIVQNYPDVDWSGNFFGSGWAQLRKFYDGHTKSSDGLLASMNSWIAAQAA